MMHAREGEHVDHLVRVFDDGELKQHALVSYREGGEGKEDTRRTLSCGAYHLLMQSSECCSVNKPFYLSASSAERGS